MNGPEDQIPRELREALGRLVPDEPPAPSPALAAFMAAGEVPAGSATPTEKGDPSVTAASNVHGPAPQVAGLPKRRRTVKQLIWTGLRAAAQAGLVTKLVVGGSAVALAGAGLAAASLPSSDETPATVVSTQTATPGDDTTEASETKAPEATESESAEATRTKTPEASESESPEPEETRASVPAPVKTAEASDDETEHAAATERARETEQAHETEHAQETEGSEDSEHAGDSDTEQATATATESHDSGEQSGDPTGDTTEGSGDGGDGSHD
jgi:hypothetical protein